MFHLFLPFFLHMIHIIFPCDFLTQYLFIYLFSCIALFDKGHPSVLYADPVLKQTHWALYNSTIKFYYVD